MVVRNKAVFGLLVVAIVCGVVAGRGASQPPPAYIVPNAVCGNYGCDTLIWGNSATDSAGNPLPAGTCTMGSQFEKLCAAQSSTNCGATAMRPTGCGGFYVVNGMYRSCYQAINQC